MQESRSCTRNCTDSDARARIESFTAIRREGAHGSMRCKLTKPGDRLEGWHHGPPGKGEWVHCLAHDGQSRDVMGRWTVSLRWSVRWMRNPNHAGCRSGVYIHQRHCQRLGTGRWWSVPERGPGHFNDHLPPFYCILLVFVDRPCRAGPVRHDPVRPGRFNVDPS